jgi:hypothetical protein
LIGTMPLTQIPLGSARASSLAANLGEQQVKNIARPV